MKLSTMLQMLMLITTKELKPTWSGEKVDGTYAASTDQIPRSGVVDDVCDHCLRLHIVVLGSKNI